MRKECRGKGRAGVVVVDKKHALDSCSPMGSNSSKLHGVQPRDYCLQSVRAGIGTY